MTASQIPAVEIACKTDPGRDPDKQVNEDSADTAETKLGQLFVVCDGMGGHAGGKEASELAVKTIVDIVKGAPEVTTPRDALKVAIEEANRAVWTMPTIEHGYRPGSTVVAILCHAGGAEIAHVGDSRIYLVHAGAISQVTKDHSMVQEMVDRNLIRAEDAPNHPDANKIMRALGIAKDVEVDLRPEPIVFASGDTFILCSDGLSDLVNAAEILDIAGSKPPAQAAGQLVDLANARGGHDNITAMVVRLKNSATAGPSATIVKTVQVTQHSPIAPTQVPDEHGSGPRGTLLAEPAAPPPGVGQTAIQMPMPPQGSISGPHQPIPPEIRAQMAQRESKPFPWIALIGILFALALIGTGVVLFVMEKNKTDHVAPAIVDTPKPSATSSTPPVDEDAAAPAIPETPPLVPTGADGGRPWMKGTHPYATGNSNPVPVPQPQPVPTGAEPPACTAARAQQPGTPNYKRLEAQCIAAGGHI